MALIQSPMLLNRDPGSVHSCEPKPEGANGPRLIARKRKCRRQSLSFEELATLGCFRFALFGQVGIPPSCEPVFEVPLALTMASENELRHKAPFIAKSLGLRQTPKCGSRFIERVAIRA